MILILTKGKWTGLWMFLQVSCVLNTLSIESYCSGVKPGKVFRGEIHSEIGNSQVVPVAHKPLSSLFWDGARILLVSLWGLKIAFSVSHVQGIDGYCKVSVSVDISSWHFLKTSSSPLVTLIEKKTQHFEKEDHYLVIFALISEIDVIYFSLLTRIQALLQQRVKHANTVADIYLFAAEFLRISSETDLVQVLFC